MAALNRGGQEGENGMIIEEKQAQAALDDLAAFQSGDVAYIKRIEEQGMIGYGVYGADGTLLTILAERELAVATILQNGLEPASVH